MAGSRPDSLTDQQNERLREVLQEALRRPKVSQTSLSKELGVSQAVISKFLSGKQGLSLMTGFRLCSITGKDPREVIGVASLAAIDSTAEADPDEDFTAAAAFFVRAMRDDPLALQVVASLRTDPQWRGKIDGAEGWLDVMKGDLRRAKNVATNGLAGLGKESMRDDGGGPRKLR